MKRGVPRGKEGVFPGIRHGQYVVDVQMLPLSVSHLLPLRWRRRLGGIASGPVIPNELVILLAPHHTRKSPTSILSVRDN